MIDFWIGFGRFFSVFGTPKRPPKTPQDAQDAQPERPAQPSQKRSGARIRPDPLRASILIDLGSIFDRLWGRCLVDFWGRCSIVFLIMFDCLLLFFANRFWIV